MISAAAKSVEMRDATFSHDSRKVEGVSNLGDTVAG